MQPDYPRAAMLALLAYNGWTVNDALLKTLRDAGMPDGQIVLISSLAGLAVISLYCAARGNLARLRPRRPARLLAIGLCQFAAFWCWLTALPRLPLANLYAVCFLTPMAVAGLAALLLKEKLGWKRALAIAAGFFGVLVSVNPAHLSVQGGPFAAYAAAAGDVAAMAAQALILRVAARHEASECIAFYQRLVMFAGGAALVAGRGGFAFPSPHDAAVVAFSGGVGSVCWMMMARAYRHAAASAVAPFQYAQLVAGALFGYFLWGNRPDAWLICGAAIIVLSGLYLVRHERRAGRVPITEAL